jgi:hypothetical protein
MTSNRKTDLLYVVIGGLCVGWFVGLSVSPVVHIVLASILALVVSAASAIAGLDKPPLEEPPKEETSPPSLPQRMSRIRIDPRPIALLVLGLAVGSSLGTYTRANNWLGADPGRIVERWKGDGLDEGIIRKKVFEELYGPVKEGGEEGVSTKPTPSGGWLFAVTAEDCDNLRMRHGRALRTELTLLNDPRVNAFLEISTDSLAMEALKQFLCADRK